MYLILPGMSRDARKDPETGSEMAVQVATLDAVRLEGTAAPAGAKSMQCRFPRSAPRSGLSGGFRFGSREQAHRAAQGAGNAKTGGPAHS